MQMLLRFPHAANRSESREHYVVHSTFTITLSAGTIFVFDAVDDIYFTHEAHFECEVDCNACVGESGWREAYVFRHVDMLDAFHCSPSRDHELLFTAEHAAAQHERRRLKQKRLARQRAQRM